MGGAALSSLGLDRVSAFGDAGAGDDVSGFGALVSARGVGTSGGGEACSSFFGGGAFCFGLAHLVRRGWDRSMTYMLRPHPARAQRDPVPLQPCPLHLLTLSLWSQIWRQSQRRQSGHQTRQSDTTTDS